MTAELKVSENTALVSTNECVGEENITQKIL